MIEYRSVNLRPLGLKRGPIEFLSADVSATATAPLVIVHLAIAGQPQRLGVRLDLDKQVFLDHLANADEDQALEESAPMVASTVIGALSAGGG